MTKGPADTMRYDTSQLMNEAEQDMKKIKQIEEGVRPRWITPFENISPILTG